VTRAAVLGTGSWGTAFAKVLVDAGTPTVMWARRAELARAVREDHQNPEYLPGITLPDALDATDDARVALRSASLVVLAVPSQTLRENLAHWRADIPVGATLVSLMKGVELGTSKRMSQVICEVAGVDERRVAVVSGPNLAREIAAGQPTATVVACRDLDRLRLLQSACTTSYFRPYTNTDVVGVELGGAVKNVIARACGIAAGLGFGDNTMASIMTRGLAETSRLGLAMGADPATFAGLAGMGDLVATCVSPLSRNRTFGEKLGRGMSVEEVSASSHQIAEGVKSCRSILDLAAANGVDMPITQHVVQVVHEGMPAPHIVGSLMGREARSE
jgi:glycerol-3-phosphate dehydrogenase (NAD(P)+)